jgi:morphogenetic protein associated with SpoVID
VKIHIVQKGDTLWNLAQKYGVDFEEMKQMNTHLADPDVLMPGMKVKVPSTAVQAKKELPKKELPKIGDILDDLKPLVKELLHEMKPEIINEIKIDLQMAQVSETNKYSIQEVKPFQPSPPPMPKVHMPTPYMAEEKPKVAPMNHPCPPFPTPSVAQGNVGHCHHGNKMGQGYNAGYGAGPMMHQAPWQPQPYQAPAQSWQQQPYQQAPITPWQNQGWNQHSPASYPSSMIPGANQGTYGMPTGHHPAHNHPHHQHRTTRSTEEDTDDTRVN